MEEAQQTSEGQQPVKKSNPIVIIIVLAVLVLAGGYYVMNRTGTPVETQQTESDQMVTEETPQITGDSSATDDTQMTASDGEATVVEVEGGAFYFKPNEIRVKRGDTVRIVFTNAGGSHDFVIDELGIKTKLTQSGESAEVEFVADTAGEYEFYCSVADHRAKGMVGTLIVE